MAQETWVIKGGSIAGSTAANDRTNHVIEELAGVGFVGVLTAASSGVDAYITVTPATTNHLKLEKMLRIIRAINARLVYTTGS